MPRRKLNDETAEETTFSILGETLVYSESESKKLGSSWGCANACVYRSESFELSSLVGRWDVWDAKILAGSGLLSREISRPEPADACSALATFVQQVREVFVTEKSEITLEEGLAGVESWARRKKLTTGRLTFPTLFVATGAGVDRKSYSTFTWTGECFLIGDGDALEDTLPVSEVPKPLRLYLIFDIISCVFAQTQAKCAKVYP